MRLWTIHPKYLDPQGLVALWREALLAKAVLQGKTKGYRNHPQLERFRAHPAPRAAINAYLAGVHAEAVSRGYSFNPDKIGPVRRIKAIAATRGQLLYEWKHLLRKLSKRNPALYRKRLGVRSPEGHPLFRVVRGPVASWERPVRR
ncbi:MAG: DNA lyase [Elusimicrobia bacterium CG11_big_fil_rev_8_21_14_0_20_64_6]|nr:MAG: DNA lyase [Elusimicrobia bacterium CG11_big_fil_rev_8_21_14_0_20_64_6]